MKPPPPHHVGDGTFRNPWLDESEREERSGGFWRWQWERLTELRAPNPAPEDLPAASPQIARPAAPPGEIRITWVGHATFLLQIGGLNLLTDPHWSRRASPLQWLGPARFVFFGGDSGYFDGYREIGGEGIMVGMHRGTFRLTDEDPLEPPVRTRAAWRDAGLPEERLRIPRHGETVVLGGNTAMRRPGGWEGQVWMADDFDGPLPPEIQRGFAGENPPAAES
ncbi:hypothetical protein BH23GEM4_BH23GEM4_01140 [soil metagenome]